MLMTFFYSVLRLWLFQLAALLTSGRYVAMIALSQIPFLVAMLGAFANHDLPPGIGAVLELAAGGIQHPIGIARHQVRRTLAFE